MSRLHSRLRRLEAGRLCGIHRTPLTCLDCEGPGALTDVERRDLERLLIRLGVMMPAGELTAPAGALRIAGSCRRCGEALYCLHCQAPGAEARYAAAYAALSPED